MLLRRLLVLPVLLGLLAPVSPGGAAAAAPPAAVAVPPGVVEVPLAVGPGTTTGPQRTTDRFEVVGVTWDAASVAPLSVDVRTRTGGTWTTWTALEPEPLAEESARGGTEPLWVGPSDAVQARLVAAPTGSPTGVRVSLVDPGTSTADAAVGPPAPGRASLTASATRQPAVRPRSAWGADESIRRGTSSSARIRAVTVHHTASSSTYDRDDVPRLLRGFYAYHVKSNGWSDIGYNFLVDRFGTVWEGRHGSSTRGVIGSHAGGFNTGTVGISMIGTYESVTPSSAMLEGVAQVAAWKLGTAGVDPRAQVRLTSGGSTRFRSGTAVTLPTVFGHRDVSTTACPGARGYAALAGLRDRAAAIVAGAGYAPPEPDPAPVVEVPVAPERLRVEAPDAVASGSTVDVVVSGVPGRPVALWFGRPGSGAQVRREDAFDSSGTYRTSFVADETWTLLATSDGESSARRTVAVPGAASSTPPPVLTVTGPVTVEAHAPALVTVGGPPGTAVTVWFRQHGEPGFRRLRDGVLDAAGTLSTSYVSDRPHDYFAMSSTLTSPDATTLVGPVPNGLHVTTPATAPVGSEVPLWVSGVPGTPVDVWFARGGDAWGLRRRGTIGPDGTYRTTWTASATHSAFAATSSRTSTRVTTAVAGAPGGSSLTGSTPALSVAVPGAVDAGSSAEVVVTGTPGAPVELWFKPRTEAVFTKRRTGSLAADGTYRTRYTALEDQEVFATSGSTASRDGAAAVQPVVSAPATGRIGQPVVLTGRARPGDEVVLEGVRAAGGSTVVRTTAGSSGTYRVSVPLTDRTTWRARAADRSGSTAPVTTVTPTLTGPGSAGRGSVVRLSGTARPGATVEVLFRRQGARQFVVGRRLVADARGRVSTTFGLSAAHRWYARADGLGSAYGLTVIR